jgi:head-tail adaptor
MASILSVDSLIDSIKSQLNEEMLKVAEPIIVKAQADIEKAMRTHMASRLIGLMASNIDIMTDGRDLKIAIRQVLIDGKKTG